MKDTYTTFEAAKILGIKYGRLREWIDRDYIVCSERADGAGSKTLFSRHNLYIIGLFVYLLEKGFKREEAAERVKAVESYLSTSKLWDKTETYNFIAIVNRPEIERQPSKSALKIVRDLVERPGPEVRIISLLEYESIPVAKIVGNEFDDLLIVNFLKIKLAVDKEL